MTTPAININAQQKITAHIYSYYNGSIVGDTETIVVQHEMQQVRPASSSHPKSISGWRDPGGWSHFVHRATTTPGNAVVAGDYSGGSYTLYSDGALWSNGVFGVPAFPTWLENSAVNKALLKLKNQSVDLSVAFGERKETGELLIKAANLTVAAIGSALDWRKGKISRKITSQRIDRHGRPIPFVMSQKGNSLWHQLKHETPQTLKRRSNLDKYGREFVDQFLEVQYGLRPLHQDAYGAVEALNERESDPTHNPYYAKVKARSRNSETVDWYRPSGINYYLGYDVKVDVDHTCLVALYYECDQPVFKSLSQLGITNPASTAYELLPFSFVLDWFLPIGNYLSAMDATLGWSFKSGTCSTMTKMKAFSSTPVNRWGTNYQFIALAPYSETGMRFQREVYSGSPGPRFPTFKNPLSGQHVANAIALAVSVFL